ncbi:MAG: hypothetical protein ACK5NF_01420 [Bacilli bacterium]
MLNIIKIITAFSFLIGGGEIYNKGSLDPRKTDNEIEFSEVNTRSNNRYYYQTITGSRRLMSSRRITKKQISNRKSIQDFIESIFGDVPVAREAYKAWAIAYNFYGMNEAGTIKTYATKITRYRVHRSTGRKYHAGTSNKIEVEARRSSGKLYKRYTYNTRTR